jgi:large subunit ribosomal protein L24
MQTIKPVKKPTKQRKMLFQAPDHIRHKHFAAPLSPELRASRGVRAIPVRSGDAVRIMRGDHKGFEGKVTRIDRKKYRIYVEGLTREKVDGTTILVPIHPSKVVITNLNLEDKWRKQVLERKRKALAIIEEVAEKPPSEEVAEIKEAAEEKVPKKKPKRRKTRVVRKPAEKKVEEKPKKPKKRKKPKRTRKKKTEKTEKEEKPETKKTSAKRKTTKKTKGGK